MKLPRKRHLLWFVPLTLILIVNISGCMTFRDSDKTIRRKLAKKYLSPTFHDYKNGKQTIHYWDIPHDDKPLVMFVHGSPGSSTTLINIAKDSTLNSNFMPVLVDRPGFGYSDFGMAEKSLSRQSELLGAILRSYPNRKKILVGHSLGGPVIAKMAMDFPEEIDAMIILAGSIAPELEPKEWYRKPMASPWFRWIIPKSFTASNDEIMAVKGELEKMLPYWDKIKIPVVVIQGAKDWLVPKENALFAKKMMTNTQVKLVMLEKESHFFPFTKPEIVVKELMLLLD